MGKSKLMSVFCCCYTGKKRPLPGPCSIPTPRDKGKPASPDPPSTRLSALPPGEEIVVTVSPPLSHLSHATVITPMESPRPTQPVVPASGIPVEPNELSQLVVEDSESDEEELECGHQSNRSSSTLQAVKTRIRRHLSQDSIPKRKARSAVGTTDEEKARRAELKRLMCKRIQEELASEDTQETGDKASSSSRAVIAPFDRKLGGGPRDNLEFSVVDLPEDMSLGKQHASDPCSSDSLGNMQTDVEPVSSRPEILQPVCHTVLRERSSLPQMPSSPNLPPIRGSSNRAPSSLASWRLSYSAGQLSDFLNTNDEEQSKQGPGRVGSKSLGVPEHQNQFLTPSPTGNEQKFVLLSRSHSSPARQSGTARGSQPHLDSPLAIWLRTQGSFQRSLSSSQVLKSEDVTTSGITAQGTKNKHVRRWSSAQEVIVSDGNITRPDTVHLYDMDIHRKLGTRGFNTPEESPTHSIRRETSRPTRDDSQFQLRFPFRKRSDSHVNKTNGLPHVPGSWVTGSSSRYTSTANSTDPSPAIFDQDFERKRSSMFKCEESRNRKLPPFFTGQVTDFAAGNLSPYASSLPDVSARNTTRVFESMFRLSTGDAQAPKRDSLSNEASETSSFHRREAELQSIDQRFSQSHLRRCPPIPVRSKFREEFLRPSLPSSPSKPSFFSRLRIPIAKKTKLSKGLDAMVPEDVHGPSPLSNVLTVASRDASNPRSSTVTRGQPNSPVVSRVSSPLKESTSELWQRAIREEARNRTSGAGKHRDQRFKALSVGDSTASETLSGKEDKSDRHKSAPLVRHRMDLKSKETSRALSMIPRPQSSNAHRAAALSASSRLPVPIPASGIQLGTARAYSSFFASDNGSPPERSKKFPDTWARYPSHTRAKRNQQTDKATPAAIEPAGDGIASVPAELSHGRHSSSSRNISPQSTKDEVPSRSMSTRLGQAVRSGIDRLISSQSSRSGAASKLSSSRQPSGDHKRTSAKASPHVASSWSKLSRKMGAQEHEMEDMHEQRRFPSRLGQISNRSSRLRLSLMLHTDGSSDFGDFLLKNAMPSAQATHRKESTTMSEGYHTAKSALSCAGDNSTSAQSQAGQPAENQNSRYRADEISKVAAFDAASVKSDGTVIRIPHSTTVAGISDLGQPKFKTWGGKISKKQKSRRSTAVGIPLKQHGGGGL